MRYSLMQWIIVIIGCAALALVQSTGIVRVFGIQPNLLFAGLVVAALFVPTFIHYLPVVAIGILALRFSLLFGKEFIILGILALLAFFVIQRLPGKAWVNVILLIAMGTMILYFLTDSSFITEHPATVFLEVAYNSMVGIVLFFAARRFFVSFLHART